MFTKFTNYLAKHSFQLRISVLILFLVTLNLLLFIWLMAIADFSSALIIVIQIIANGVTTLLAVFLGQVLANTEKNKGEKRIRKFFLGMIWHELLYNLDILENLDLNFQMINKNYGNLNLFEKKTAKITNLVQGATSLEFTSFIASQNSHSITTLDSDDLFNEMISAYLNIRNLIDSLKIVSLDFNQKIKDTHDLGYTFTSLPEDAKETLVEQIFFKYRIIDNNLKKALASVEKTTDLIDKKLTSLGVNLEVQKY